MKTASTSIDLISKKNQICTCSTLFVFLCRCFAQLQRCFMGLKRQNSNLHIILWRNCRMCLPSILSPVFMFTFIFHCRSFSPCWPLAFLIIVSQPLWIFMSFLLQNSSPLFSIVRSSSFSQITSKKIRLCCCFLFQKIRAVMWFLSK